MPLALGQNLKEQLSPALIKFHIPKLIDTK